ncbi:ROK family protein [Bosea sp. 2RAB26]|uniref:ROK family protein n=2 Tax=Pseudomonadota TaxID=1224 RepID=UPI003F8F66BF
MTLPAIDQMLFSDGHGSDRARAFTLVARGQAHSRPEIGAALGLRSTTTSRLVGDLVERRLLLETAGQKAGRGRPAGILIANPRRVGASVIYVASQSLVGALVDLDGQLLEERVVEIASDADNRVVAGVMAGLGADLLAAMPRGMEHAGTAVSLSGLLDLRRKQWLMSSRWPNLRGLDVGIALGEAVGPVVVCRNLDAELRARMAQDSEQFSDGALLLHWGWGIGLGYAIGGRSLAPPGGSFGEVGHWRFAALDGRRCGCGNTACLETGAALWSLLPELRRRWPDLAEDENRLYRQLARCDLTSLPEIDTAARLLARALANASRLLFPTRIIVTGPFVANAQLWAHFDGLFRAEGTMHGFMMPELVSDRSSRQYEVHGAATPLLSKALEGLLQGA